MVRVNTGTITKPNSRRAQRGNARGRESSLVWYRDGVHLRGKPPEYCRPSFCALPAACPIPQPCQPRMWQCKEPTPPRPLLRPLNIIGILTWCRFLTELRICLGLVSTAMTRLRRLASTLESMIEFWFRKAPAPSRAATGSRIACV